MIALLGAMGCPPTNSLAQPPGAGVAPEDIKVTWPMFHGSPQRAAVAQEVPARPWVFAWRGQWGLVHTSPVLAGGMVFCTTKRGVVALDAHDGTTLWGAALGASVFSSPVLVGDLVLVGTGEGWLCALDREGTVVWRYRARYRVHSTPAVDETGIYFGAGDHALYALKTVRDDLPMPRGDVVAAVVEAVGLGKCASVPETLNLHRVPRSDPRYAAMETAVSHCLLGHFADPEGQSPTAWIGEPGFPMRREEFASFLYKLVWMFNPLGIVVPAFREVPASDRAPRWMTNVPGKIVGSGLLKPKGGDRFAPRELVTRGEVRQACELLRQWKRAPNREYSLIARLTELAVKGERRDRPHFAATLRCLGVAPPSVPEDDTTRGRGRPLHADAVPGILEKLASDDPARRREAASDLDRLGLTDADEEAIGSLAAPLTRALADGDVSVRRAAAEALRRIAPGLGDEAARVSAVRALVARARDADPNVRKASAHALAQIAYRLEDADSKRATLLVLSDGLGDQDETVQASFASALASLTRWAQDDPGFAQIAPTVLDALEHGGADVRRRAAEVSGAIARTVTDPALADAAAEALIGTLSDAETAVRLAAVRALWRAAIGRTAGDPLPRLADATWQAPAVRALTKILEDADGRAGDRRQATSTLTMLWWHVVEVDLLHEAVEALITAVADDEANVQLGAAKALGQIAVALDNESAVQSAVQAVERLLKHEDASVRLAAAWALWTMRARLTDVKLLDRALGTIVAELGGERSASRTMALRHLSTCARTLDERATFDFRSAVEPLKLMLRDNRPDTRLQAAEALHFVLRHAEDEGARSDIAKILSAELGGAHRYHAMRVVAVLAKDAEDVELLRPFVKPLTELLDAEDSGPRIAAAKALCRVCQRLDDAPGQTRAVGALVVELNGADENARRSARSALTEVASEVAPKSALEPAVSALATRLEDEDPRTRLPCAAALLAIGPDAAPAATQTAARDVLTEGIRHSDTAVQAQAASALASVARTAEDDAWLSRVIPLLGKMMQDQSVDVRASAAWSLGAIAARPHDGAAARAALEAFGALLEDERPPVRAIAVWSLERVGSPEARDALDAYRRRQT